VHRRIHRPSPSLVISLFALFIALGGIGYAATLPKNSVGTAQLKNKAVVSTKLGSSAVTSAAIRSKAVGIADIADKAVGQRALADQAVNGAKIASRAVGVSDIASQAVGGRALASRSVSPAKLNVKYVSVSKFSGVIEKGQTGYRNVRVACPDNHRVIGGGGGWVGPTTTDPLQSASFITGSRPFPPSATGDNQDAWEVYGDDASPGSRRLMATAICIPIS
jgi:hypothetical protein